MSLKFNIDRPKVSDEEIARQQDFKSLVEKFRQQSLKKARSDDSWWKEKKVRYSTVIAGITVVCTITYFALFNKENKNLKTTDDKTTTLSPPQKIKQTATTNAAFIKAPSEKLKTPYSTYKVNNAAGGNFTHPTATKIRIPKNSFVDKNGKDIIGDVTIEYKEFHDVADVIGNGIPMAYDSAGTKYNLETAGMFDIRGTQNGEPVYIAPSKNIQVELASANKENRFNQYYLDTIERNWKYIKKDLAVPYKNSAVTKQKANGPVSTPEIVALRKEIDVVIPRKIDSVKVVYTVKADKLSKPKQPSKPVKQTTGRPNFKLEGNYEEIPELAVFNNVIFEVGPENKNYSQEFHEITWSDVKVSEGPVKGTNYLLNLKYRSRSEKLIVYPVFSDEDFVSAKKTFDQKLQSYNVLVEKRAAEEKRLIAEMSAKQAAYLAGLKKREQEYELAVKRMRESSETLAQNELKNNYNTMSFQVKAQRIFSVSQFGIFNSDCPHAAPGGRSVAPIFITDGNSQPVFADFVYLVDHSRKTVYALSKQTGFNIEYRPDVQYSICAFSKNRMFLCAKESFKQTSDKEGNRFQLTELPEGSDNISDLRKALEI